MALLLEKGRNFCLQSARIPFYIAWGRPTGLNSDSLAPTEKKCPEQLRLGRAQTGREDHRVSSQKVTARTENASI